MIVPLGLWSEESARRQKVFNLFINAMFIANCIKQTYGFFIIYARFFSGKNEYLLVLFEWRVRFFCHMAKYEFICPFGK